MKRYRLMGILLALFVVSCASGPQAVPDDMPPAKIIQKAQEALDYNKYKTALYYYEILEERYSDRGEYLATAEYEKAFIRYKQRKYALAREGFENLLIRYNLPDGEPLPPRFKILSERVLARMAQKGR